VSYITPSNVSYLPHSNVTNEFLATFENVISSANLSLPPDFEAFVPIILENRKILCRKSHKGIISNARIYSFIEMLNAGMLSLERYGDQQLRRRACPEFVADRAMFLMLLEVILFL